MMWWSNGGSWGGWIVMALAMVAFWALVIFGIIAVFRGTRDDPSARTPDDHCPWKILDERFARGEIDADEYRARQDALRTAH
ncbi:hypothetical protein GCM10014719_70080 [Planomonospora parontospora subsp. antibiotica]|nr:hypothetical protein GCM10014719_70080 [Planomonospora parontospora subsp. antibiotica]GII18001.1 hypothetical protein Ppa05_47270 [Planomonospora parontospora subsp. antibiotica]